MQEHPANKKEGTVEMGDLKGLYISDALHRRVKEYAAREGMTIREAVEAILEQKIKKNGVDNGLHRDKGENPRNDRQ